MPMTAEYLPLSFIKQLLIVHLNPHTHPDVCKIMLREHPHMSDVAYQCLPASVPISF